jgi:hypothetical protein
VNLAVILLLIVCIGMPLGYAWRIWRADEPSRAAWLAVVADSTVLVALLLILGRWDIAGYYTRFVLLAVFLAATVLSWGRHASRPFQATEGKPIWRSHWTTLGSLILFSAALVYVLSGMLPAAERRELAFPLRGGRFMVAQGGGITLLNHHADHREQRYAADITAINGAGFRARGLLPEELDRYVIFGATVVSPCEGEVIGTRDGLPDLPPPASDRKNPAGNHVILSCGGINVELAHLRQGSISVETGDRLEIGEEIGRVGNSGHTTEPHLHIHAGDPQRRVGVPISFDGRNPVRNRLFRL